MQAPTPGAAAGPRVPILVQWFVPAAAFVLAAVAVTAVATAWLVAAAGRRDTERRLDQLAEALASSSFPRTPEALAKLAQITGDAWALWDYRRARAIATSGPIDPAWLARVGKAAREQLAQAGRPQLAAPELGLATARVVPLRDDPGAALLAFAPASGDDVRRAALRTAAAVAGASLLALVPAALWLARRLRRRLARVGRDVRALAEGAAPAPERPGAWRDELSDLGATVRDLAERLRDSEAQRQAAERAEAAAHWAAGVAHQFRNGLAGVRLGIQLHERRCPAAADDASLRAATAQLRLVEEEINGLLALGKPGPVAREAVELAALARQAAELVRPQAAHLGAEVLVADGPASLASGHPASLRSALVALALNAVEAAGEDGHVVLRAERRGAEFLFLVEDDGPGPPPELAAALAEPYVTSKPAGLGIGLSVARAVAAAHGGALRWRRAGARTVFELSIPAEEQP